MNHAQCRMARAALNIGVRELAEAARVSTNTITRLEAGEPLKPRTVDAIRQRLEGWGAEFTNGGQPGVRISPAAPLRAFADHFRRSPPVFVREREMLAPEELDQRRKRVEELMIEVDRLADAVRQRAVSSLEFDVIRDELQALGTLAPDHLVFAVARAFVAARSGKPDQLTAENDG